MYYFYSHLLEDMILNFLKACFLSSIVSDTIKQRPSVRVSENSECEKYSFNYF